MSDRARVRIQWRYKDKTGTYEDPIGEGSVSFDEDGNPNFFWWEEGNASCDCNRSAFFGLVNRDEDEWFPCGETIEVLSMEVIK